MGAYILSPQVWASGYGPLGMGLWATTLRGQQYFEKVGTPGMTKTSNWIIFCSFCTGCQSRAKEAVNVLVLHPVS